MRDSIHIICCLALAISATGCASTGGHDTAAARDLLFRRIHRRIGRGELLRANSRKVGQLLQASEWLANCSVRVTYGGLGQGPFHPRITVSLHPDPSDSQGLSTHYLCIHFSGREIQSEQDARAFLLGRFNADDPLENPHVTGYIMADGLTMYEFPADGALATPVLRHAVSAKLRALGGAVWGEHLLPCRDGLSRRNPPAQAQRPVASDAHSCRNGRGY